MDSNKADTFLDVRSSAHPMLNMFRNQTLDDFDLDFNPDARSIQPTPAYCIKAKTVDGSKLFINICHSPEIPPPPDALMQAKNWQDCESIFRFPISVGEPHSEVDKKGDSCTCYDIIVNTDYCKKIQNKDLPLETVISLGCSSVQDKYKVDIMEDSCTVLNKSYHGKMPLHFIRNSSTRLEKPSLINDIIIPSENASKSFMTPKKSTYTNKNQTEVQKNLSPLPDSAEILPAVYNLFELPENSSVNAMIFEANFPKCHNKGCTLIDVSVSKQRLLVKEAKCGYMIDVALPKDVISEKCRANFCAGDLTVFLPVMVQN